MSFKLLIECTKQVEFLQAKHADLLSSNASDEEVLAVSKELQVSLNALAKAASSAFSSARTGDQIHVISGRKNGDDQDTVGVFFSGSENTQTPKEYFIRNFLEQEPYLTENEERDIDAEYFIISESTLDAELNTN